jgi:hypothetical protein
MRKAATGGARLVVAENLYGYGPVEGPMSEDTPLRATTRKGSTRAAMHRILQAAHQAGRIDMAVARGADFFGPGVTQAALGAEVFTALLSGARVRVLGNPDLPHSWGTNPGFWPSRLGSFGFFPWLSPRCARWLSCPIRPPAPSSLSIRNSCGHLATSPPRARRRWLKRWQVLDLP